jgi:type I restriction enzyme S subunit
MKQGWTLKSVKDVAQVIAGQSPEGRYYNTDGVGLPFYQGKKEFGDKYIKPSGVWTSVITKTAIAGDILMSVRAPVGPVNVSVGEICIGRGLAAIRQKDNVLHDFLFYFFKYYEGNIKGNTGAVFDSINKAQIENIPFLIPPLPEQQRIVSIIDKDFEAIDKAIENTQKNLQNAKELFESYLNSVFENGGEGWVEKTLGDVCTLYQGIAINAKTRNALVEKSDLPLLRIKDLKNNTVEQYIDPNNYPKNALVTEEDIIYTRTGSLGLVFKGKRGVLHNNSFKVIPNKLLDNDFLFKWLQNPIFKSKIMELALKAAQPDITHAIFKIQEIAIPPLKAQQIIVQKLDVLQVETKNLEANYHQKISDLEELKKSILNKAFAGEL